VNQVDNVDGVEPLTAGHSLVTVERSACEVA